MNQDDYQYLQRINQLIQSGQTRIQLCYNQHQVIKYGEQFFLIKGYILFGNEYDQALLAQSLKQMHMKQIQQQFSSLLYLFFYQIVSDRNFSELFDYLKESDCVDVNDELIQEVVALFHRIYQKQDVMEVFTHISLKSIPSQDLFLYISEEQFFSFDADFQNQYHLLQERVLQDVYQQLSGHSIQLSQSFISKFKSFEFNTNQLLNIAAFMLDWDIYFLSNCKTLVETNIELQNIFVAIRTMRYQDEKKELLMEELQEFKLSDTNSLIIRASMMKLMVSNSTQSRQRIRNSSFTSDISPTPRSRVTGALHNLIEYFKSDK